MKSDGEALTALRFGEEQLGLRSENSYNGTIPYPTPKQTIPVFDKAKHWLDNYFNGKWTENATMGKLSGNAAISEKADAQIVVKPKGTMFQQRVWQALLMIPYGETINYGAIAQMVGCRSAQAVGQAIRANPIALLIPCHRVIAAHGKLGGYEYGQELKRQLLELEKRLSPTQH